MTRVEKLVIYKFDDAHHHQITRQIDNFLFENYKNQLLSDLRKYFIP